jgi:hypothetical protein
MNIRALKTQVNQIKQMHQNLQREVDALIWELAPMSSPDIQRRLGVDQATVTANPTRSSSKQTTHGFSDDVKEQVKSALSTGMTIEQASKDYGPSTFTIKAWKKSWGMVRSRKK